MNQIRSRARALRKNSTEVERLLWRHLRMWQLDGYKFRRQQPIGNYIVDFVCLEKRLIIELDGGQHAEQSHYDSERDAWLRDQRFTVLRFWNNDVLINVEGVAARIFETLKSSPFLNPSPQGGRRRIRGKNPVS
ncbi:MAG: endonuclease domain-containing protein [Deltaproteobacteria bacterium]|nr:endonuclease domain-containing protein [Deltaproteobacteria bacterium]MBI3066896.1 endonuclease domain-containing protein [Deltaproteobacteria bacterium]